MPTQIDAGSAAVERAADAEKFDYLDLKAQYAGIREEVIAAIARVMDSQHFILGSEVEQFEKEVAAYLGASYCVSCASGSDALVLALMASGIGPGDEIITSPFTFFATGGSIARTGAKPVFVDIEPETFNISPAQIEAAITQKTRGIMPVHLFGLAADLDPILEIAKKHCLIVVEDAAQAIGAKYKGKPVGTIGDYGCFSFFPSKNLGGAGDGGLVTTENRELADKLRILRVHGSRKKYHHEILGINSRLDAIQAAILRVKLRYLDEWKSRRQNRADRYRQLFKSCDLSQEVRIADEPGSDFHHVYNQFTIRCARRDSLRDHLRGLNIPTEIYYPLPLHLQPAFSYLAYESGHLPNAEKASREVLSLPVYPELRDAQQGRVVQAIANFYR